MILAKIQHPVTDALSTCASSSCSAPSASYTSVGPSYRSDTQYGHVHGGAAVSDGGEMLAAPYKRYQGCTLSIQTFRCCWTGSRSCQDVVTGMVGQDQALWCWGYWARLSSGQSDGYYI